METAPLFCPELLCTTAACGLRRQWGVVHLWCLRSSCGPQAYFEGKWHLSHYFCVPHPEMWGAERSTSLYRQALVSPCLKHNEVQFLSLIFLGATLSCITVVCIASQNKELTVLLIVCRYWPEINYSVEILKVLMLMQMKCEKWYLTT